MIEAFLLPFMQRALIAGVMVGFLASYFGAFVVQRGLSFMGSGLAHAAFGGVALGLLLQNEPMLIALPFTIVVAIGIVWVREHTALGNDTVVGIFFSVSMALGVLFLFLRREYSGEAFTYLFGSILSVSLIDIYVTALVLLLSIATWPVWRRWAYASFDRELALSDRLPVQRDDYLLAIFIAVTVVTAIKVVGILLVASFLVIPAAAARLFSRRFASMTVISTAFGVGSAVCGLFFSYALDVPSGAAIILLQALIFFTALLLRGHHAR